MRRPRGGANRPQWSLYDVRNNREHQLAESVIMEYTDIVGIECSFYSRDDSITYDRLYGEHTATAYEEPKKIKIIYDVSEEPNLWSAAGMFGGDVLVAHVPQATWRRDIGAGTKPMIGDVFKMDWYSPLDGTDARTFEIAHVDDDDKTFQLRKMIYLLVLKPYRFSEQSDSAGDLAMHSKPISAYGDNEWLETESDIIEDYSDVDTKIYGF